MSIKFARGFAPALCLMFVLVSVVGAEENEVLRFGVDNEPAWDLRVGGEGGDIVVVIPSNRTSVNYYSPRQDRWTALKLDEPLDPKNRPSVAGELAAFHHRKSIFAYSAKTCSWDRLTLPDNVKPNFVMDGKTIKMTYGDSLFVFGENSHAWSGINLETGEPIALPLPARN